MALVVVLQLVVLALSEIAAEQRSAELECHVDGTCTTTEDDSAAAAAAATTVNTDKSSIESTIAQCGLYMAESSIPGAGWGVYTGNDVASGIALDFHDVVIQYADHEVQSELQKYLYGIKLPEILLSEYFWEDIETDALFDADSVESISPGFGMLANCHLGVVNLDQASCRTRSSGPRSDASAGSSSSYQDCEFVTRQPIPAGHELFDDYGDSWFSTRSRIFGDDLPLSKDSKKADKIVQLWQHEVDGRDPDLAADLWETVVQGIGPHITGRFRRALPKSAQDAAKIDFDVAGANTAAYLAFPNIIRSIEWLNENGMCLDHIEVKPVSVRGNQERGAFARRFIPAGAMVAPAPVVHLSRKHTDMLYVDTNGSPKKMLWQGHQLLLNYCYGHPSSSVLIFPYSPGVNLINHADKSMNQKPNVAVRWSERMAHAEWMMLNATALIEQNTHAGLMMEFYALTDIDKGDEILLDYGDNWQKAWDEHVENWNRNQRDPDTAVVHTDDYISAWDYAKQCDQDIAQDGVYDCMYNTPTWIDVRCWVASKLKTVDNDWLDWSAPPMDDDDSDHRTLDETRACKVLSVEDGSLYRIRVQKSRLFEVKTGLQVMNVPRWAIAFVDRPYTNNQFLRQAFRHEIQLPDEMMPSAWRDLEPEPDSTCGLYMAESAIPNSGLGMYSAKAFSIGEKIFFGDIVVQVEDIYTNTKLRHWSANDFDYKENDWLLHNYYWDSLTSIGNFDAADVQSIIPGLGMLSFIVIPGIGFVY